MKRVLVFFIALLTIGNVNAQSLTYDSWTVIPYVDEFERPTGDTARVVLCKGKFSNSATSGNTKFTAKLTLDTKSETISIGLFEYNRMPTASMAYKHTFGTVIALVGKDSQNASNFSKVFAPKSGGLYVTKKENPELYEAITTQSYIYFLVKGTHFDGASSRTSYNFEMKLK